MLTVMATFAAEFLSLAVYIIVRYVAHDVGWPKQAQILPPLLLFIALITGLISLLLIPLVYQFRSSPPPGSITTVAAVVGAAPLIVLAALIIAARY